MINDPSLKLNLRLQTKPQQKLTPLQIQSTRILGMNSQELYAYVSSALNENPLLEASYENVSYKSQAYFEEDVSDYGTDDEMIEGLLPFLRDQLERKHLPEDIFRASLYLTQLLNADGYLDKNEVELLPFSPKVLEESVLQLQSLDPAGIGAFDLSECLTLQLKRAGKEDSLCAAITRSYLPQLSEKKYRLIARKLSCSVSQVEAAAKVIAKLNPRPALIFLPKTQSEYIRPDVFVTKTDDRLQIVLNESYLPKLSINEYYSRLLKESKDPDTKEYLQTKMQNARVLLKNLSRRGETLKLCAEVILERQHDFFSGKTNELNPLSAVEISKILDIHPSTVSRTLRGKYLQCEKGMYALGYFCSKEVTNDLSRQAIKLRLMQLIKSEDQKHPLSDPKLCELLKENGIDISRRTVSKYREELGIPNITGRRI